MTNGWASLYLTTIVSFSLAALSFYIIEPTLAGRQPKILTALDGSAEHHASDFLQRDSFDLAHVWDYTLRPSSRSL